MKVLKAMVFPLVMGQGARAPAAPPPLPGTDDAFVTEHERKPVALSVPMAQRPAFAPVGDPRLERLPQAVQSELAHLEKKLEGNPEAVAMLRSVARSDSFHLLPTRSESATALSREEHQIQLLNLVGGKSPLSEHVRSRIKTHIGNNLAPSYVEIIRDIYDSSYFRPSVVSDVVKLDVSKLSSQAHQEKFAFAVDAGNGITVKVSSHRMGNKEIIVRDWVEPAAHHNGVPNKLNTERIVELLSKLPPDALKSLDEVWTCPRRMDGHINVHAAAAVVEGKKRMYLFHGFNEDDETVMEHMLHELGHLEKGELLAKEPASSLEQDFKQAALDDGLVPSHYCKENWVENHAEVHLLRWVSELGGYLDEARKIFPRQMAQVENAMQKLRGR